MSSYSCKINQKKMWHWHDLILFYFFFYCSLDIKKRVIALWIKVKYLIRNKKNVKLINLSVVKLEAGISENDIKVVA